MPIYEYRCTHCKHFFQKLQAMSAGSDGVRCPKCEGARVERQLSTFASTPTTSGAGGTTGCAPSGGG